MARRTCPGTTAAHSAALGKAPCSMQVSRHAFAAFIEYTATFGRSAKCFTTEFSQFHVPRSARIARHSAVNQAPSPRSNVEFQELLHSSAWLGHQRQNAWPNPSFELTHYSKALGPCGAFVYHAPHGPIPLLPWAAQFQR